MSIGEQIRRARLARGLSQTDVAKLAGVSARTVSRIERDQHAEPRKRGAVLHGLGLGDLGEAGEPLLRYASGHQLTAELLTRLHELDQLRAEVAKLRAEPAPDSGPIPDAVLAEMEQPPDPGGAATTTDR